MSGELRLVLEVTVHPLGADRALVLDEVEVWAAMDDDEGEPPDAGAESPDAGLPPVECVDPSDLDREQGACARPGAGGAGEGNPDDRRRCRTLRS